MLLFIALCTLLSCYKVIADPYLTLNLIGTSPYISYFPVGLNVTTSDGSLTTVQANITCSGVQASSVTADLTSPSLNIIPVPAPNYNGVCVAFVSSPGYDSNLITLPVQNYTQCQQLISGPGSNQFSATQNASYSVEYSNFGPLGYISIDPISGNSGLLTLNQFDISISNTENSVIFYQTNCTDNTYFSLYLYDGAPTSLNSCSSYASETSFNPANPFSNLYGSQAQDQYTITGYVNTQVGQTDYGSIDLVIINVCLATNYIVLNTSSSTIVPGSNMTYTASLGVSQSIKAPVLVLLSCESNSTNTTISINSTLTTFNITVPPDVALGTTCTLAATNTDPIYAAPAFLTLTTATPVTLSLPSASAVAGSNLAYNLFVSSNPSTSATFVLNLYCENSLVGTKTTNTSSTVQYFLIASAAIGPCTLNATSTNPDYADSNTVSVNVYQQLVFSSPLSGWVGGTTVNVNISSLNLQRETALLLTTCPTGSYSQNITTSTSFPYSLPSSLSGFNCLLSTPQLLEYYLALQTTHVTISLSQAESRKVIGSLNLQSFANASAPPTQVTFPGFQSTKKLKNKKQFEKALNHPRPLRQTSLMISIIHRPRVHTTPSA